MGETPMLRYVGVPNRLDAPGDVLRLVHAQLGDAFGDVLTADRGGEGFVLQLLLYAFRLQVRDAVRANLGTCDDEAGQLVHREERFGHRRGSRRAAVLSVA